MLKERIRKLNNISTDDNSRCVIYIMSRDQRVNDNHALIAAQKHAIKHKLPLIVLFNAHIKRNRAKEHYAFMFKGLASVRDALQKHNISFVLKKGNPVANIVNFSKSSNPAAIYFDFSPLKGALNTASSVARKVSTPCYQVDTHNIVPVWVASQKQEYAAHTFRPKVHNLLARFLTEPTKVQKHPFTYKEQLPDSFNEISAQALSLMPTNNTAVEQKPSEHQALKTLEFFLKTRLKHYSYARNNPTVDALTNLSPYLHFGQISSLRVALNTISHVNTEPHILRSATMPTASTTQNEEHGMNTLLEELIVRKELADNFCLYAKDYKNFSSVPPWAQTTLQKHSKDTRDFIYNKDQWEHANTHDPAWNACQTQLLKTGKLHGYMRMYWAKKMLEWSASPEQALQDCIYLNDFYSIDGGDPNGYVGILWAIAGLHDRPWFERSVFGTIRYMNDSGLKRKFPISDYINTWA